MKKSSLLYKIIKADRGTDIVLHLGADFDEYLEDSKIEGLLKKYCRFLPIEIAFGKKKEWKDGKQDEFDLSGKTFYMLTQARDLDALHRILSSKKGNVFNRENIENFSFEKFPCENQLQYASVNPSPSYDLLYGGTLRAGRRIKKIVNWYYNHPSLNIELLYGADGKKHIQGFLASFRVAQTSHTVMPRVESQVLKLMRFVNKNMVDAHLLEVHHVVRARLDGMFQQILASADAEDRQHQNPQYA